MQLCLALLMVGSSLGYLTVGTVEQQARARGALAGSVVVAAIGVGLMWVWPWPSAGLVDTSLAGARRRRFGGQRGDGA